jgi:type I restriction enzyme R subunit
MRTVGRLERETQDDVVELFRDRLGYEHLGEWKYTDDNANIEASYLKKNLEARGCDPVHIDKAIERLRKAAALGGGRKLYDANKAVYELLRYGVKVKRAVGESNETVWPIDWKDPKANHFAIAEEVTVHGRNTKRPDVVLYVNGIAVAVIELKRSKVAVSEGIHQSLTNQTREFIPQFFATVQMVMAGNETEGLRYAPIGAPEKYWLAWREESEIKGALERALTQLCSKERLLEMIHDFTVFDAGTRKLARHNQYFGVKAAQERIGRREGGIIWHTQGSGKSLTMVWLAKWIRENVKNSRVLIVSDRIELDEQIEKVFQGVGEEIHRTGSAADMLAVLNGTTEWLICSLIHKFRGSESERDRDEAERKFIEELRTKIPKGFSPKGDLFVFIDEAHRTQSGKMHKALKGLLPGAMLIGFTGTPLLKTEKQTSIETFGSFIHTYKVDEAIADKVVLELRYEARDIDQHLTSGQKVDEWFEAKTKGMTDLSKASLKKRWVTMQKVVSAEPRARQIVQDILFDMATKPHLADGRGNAILVSSSIYQACKFYELFSQTELKGRCAIVTSYEPHAGGVSKEETGEGATERLRQHDIYRQMLAEHFDEPADDAMRKVEQFEKEVKKRFIEAPGQMRLLIVVDKLLTGFDAPSATYLYIDKRMSNHGLFQAICRVNRLGDEDKEYGYIVDYRDLFNSLRRAIADYTSGALDGYDRDDIKELLTSRIEKGREDLDRALEEVRTICEPVAPPKGTTEHQQYFCAAEQGNAQQLKENEFKRVELYKAVAAAVRAYGNIANEMAAAGYSDSEAAKIKDEIGRFYAVRDEVRIGAGEDVDLKQYEAGMRFLLDTYIQADPSETVGDFKERGLVELIAEMGADVLETLPAGIRNDPDAVTETIANNIRKVIVDERALNPKFYDKMSELLDALIEERRREAIDYRQYLQRLIAQAEALGRQESGTAYPAWADDGAKRALHDFGLPSEDTTREVDETVRRTKPADWVGNPFKEKKIRRALAGVLPAEYDRLDELMALLKARDEYR